MTRADDLAEAGPDEIVTIRVFDAPRELVFRNWIKAEDVQTWFAPDGFTVTSCEVDARPGGRWRVEYRSTHGSTYVEHGEFREIVEPERLIFSLMQEDGDHSGPETLVTVTFAEAGEKTEMTFRQTGFDSMEKRAGNAEGWNECFAKLDAHLAETHDRRDIRR